MRITILLIAIALTVCTVNAKNYINGVDQALYDDTEVFADLASVSNLLDNTVGNVSSISNALDIDIGNLASVSNLLDNTVGNVSSISNALDIDIGNLASVSNLLDNTVGNVSSISNALDIDIGNLASVSNELDNTIAGLVAVSNSTSSNILNNVWLKIVVTNNGAGITSNNIFVTGAGYFMAAQSNVAPLYIGHAIYSDEYYYGIHTDQTLIVFATGHSGTNALGLGSTNAHNPRLVYNQDYYNGGSQLTNYDLLGIDSRGTKENSGWFVRGDQSVYSILIRTNKDYEAESLLLYSPDGTPNHTGARSASFAMAPGTESDFGIYAERGISTPKWILYAKINPGGNLQKLYLGGSTNQNNIDVTMRGSIIMDTNRIVGNADNNGTRWIANGGTNIYQVFQGTNIGFEVRFPQ